MYSRNNIFKLNESSNQYFFKAGTININEIQKYSNFLHTHCNKYNAVDITNRRSLTSTTYLFNVTVIKWYAREKMRHPQAVPLQKQEKCIYVYFIITGLETLTYQYDIL